MLQKLKEIYIKKKIAKLKRYPLFHLMSSELIIRKGNFGSGNRKHWNILFDNGLKYRIKMKNATVIFDKNNNIVISGTEEKNPKVVFFEKIDKKKISFLKSSVIPSITLDEDLDLVATYLNATLDLVLENGESIIVQYKIETEKNKAIV